MSISNIGANGLKGDYMSLKALGELQISVVPTPTDAEVSNVDIAAENRREVLHMTTNKGETVDQFCQRIRSMLRSLMNGEPRVKQGEELKKAEAAGKTATWA